MIQRSLLRVLIICILMIAQIQKPIFAEPSAKLSPLATSINDINKVVETIPPTDSSPNQNEVQIRDVYDALLKTKDDKIILLSNIINWLLAGAASLLILVTGFFGWLNKKIKKQKSEVDTLIVSLKLKEEEIAQTQQKIDSFLNSIQFTEKLEQIETALDKVNNLVHRWEQEEIERKIDFEKRRRDRLINWVGDRLRWFSVYNKMHERINNVRDELIFEELKAFENLTQEEKETWTDQELEALSSRGSVLIQKYRQPTDELI
ncbi:hypothetical protein [Paenibacillus sinopodophylli]|uniref:hypothetical protein n=1 Tax=Paenibacillus sinopodophylli TaxID=1837342 RepID=UPI00110CB0F8|nr:hypothetical protein [Paenibacillus sinopodophylli]